MSLVITVVLIGWIASALVRTADKRSRERHYAAARNRERSFDYRLREAEIETKRILAESKAETERIIALEKARIEQEKWNAKQEEINRKTEEKLRKHDEEIRKLKQAMLVAEVDIKSANERMSYLYSLLDIAEKQQRDAHPGSKSDEAAQRKIMTLRNQLATAKKNQIKSKSKYNELKFKMDELKEVA